MIFNFVNQRIWFVKDSLRISLIFLPISLVFLGNKQRVLKELRVFFYACMHCSLIINSEYYLLCFTILDIVQKYARLIIYDTLPLLVCWQSIVDHILLRLRLCCYLLYMVFFFFLWILYETIKLRTQHFHNNVEVSSWVQMRFNKNLSNQYCYENVVSVALLNSKCNKKSSKLILLWIGLTKSYSPN